MTHHHQDCGFEMSESEREFAKYQEDLAASREFEEANDRVCDALNAERRARQAALEAKHRAEGPCAGLAADGYMHRQEDCDPLLKQVLSDSVNNPAHYQTGAGIECIDVIEEVLDSGNLSPKQAYLWGSAFKYLWRLGRKGEALEDGRKAEWFLKRLNGHLEAQ